jgi:uncharacterized protein (DUF2236 family)
MQIRYVIPVLFAFLGCVALFDAFASAQTVKPATTSATSAAPAQPSAGQVTQPVSADLTEAEKAKLENLQLKFSLLGMQKKQIPADEQQLQQAYSDLIRKIQVDHPGFYWDAQAAALKPIPKPAPAPDKSPTPAKTASATH